MSVGREVTTCSNASPTAHMKAEAKSDLSGRFLAYFYGVVGRIACVCVCVDVCSFSRLCVDVCSFSRLCVCGCVFVQ